ncbi:hypothetical protein HGRIS_011550 [Hohenbuehelia grisea]|uniref:Ubiquitin-like domain-containing protein n=1 Tax=Hohenbuehelia grisea TaxID=104357 RepID=A0ABR3JVL6_9AGAR
MADQAERAFAQAFLKTISTQPVTYPNDYQSPPETSLKRVPVLAVDVPEPPARKEAATSSAELLVITIKSLKPPANFSLSIRPTDSIADVKALLAREAGAPPADAQRLLLKGKALADTKLVREYAVKDGDTVNLMMKPGVEWDPSKTTSASHPGGLSGSIPAPSSPGSITLVDPTKSTPAGKRHQRIPSVVLSPSPSSGSPVFEKPMDITLSIDPSTTGGFPTDSLSTYHATVAKPAFWSNMRTFLSHEFAAEGDALQAFEDFLCATKGTLTASEIAKIRDEVGVIGMAGT